MEIAEQPIEIRRIRADDVEPYRSIRLAALRADPTAFGSTLERELAFNPTLWEERCVAASSGNTNAMFLAWRGGTPVGIVGGFEFDQPGTIDLVSMWVAPEARRRALGRQLVAAVTTWAESSSAARVELWVTRGNDAARALYRDMGFVDVDLEDPIEAASVGPLDPCRDEDRMRLML